MGLRALWLPFSTVNTSLHDIDFLSFVHASLLADLLGLIHIKTYKIEKPKWSTTIHIVDETNRLFIKSYPRRKQRNQHRVTAIRENTSKTQIQKIPSIGLKAPHSNLTYFKTAYRFHLKSAVIRWRSGSHFTTTSIIKKR